MIQELEMTNYYSDEFRKLIQKYDLAHTRWDSDISEKALSILLEDYYIEQSMNNDETIDDDYLMLWSLKFNVPFNYTYEQIYRLMLDLEQKYMKRSWEYIPCIEFSLTNEESDKYIYRYFIEHVNRYFLNGLSDLSSDYIIDTFIKRCHDEYEYIDEKKLKHWFNEFINPVMCYGC